MILIHPASGRILAEKNADTPLPMASTTKLMTALLAAERASPDREIVILDRWTGVEGSSMYLRPGETYTLRELLEGLLLASGNDAALAIAETVCADADSFVALMNRRAAELGMEHTHFTDPHGLGGSDHYSTAADLGRLMTAALTQPLLREIMAERTCRVRDRVLVNHNRLLGSCPGVTGGKTGYTRAAGRCLVTCCVRDGLELVCVTLSDPEDWRDHAALYDWAYGAYEAAEISADTVRVSVPLANAEGTAVAVPAETVSLCVEKGRRLTAAATVPPFVFAPVRGTESAGRVSVLSEGAALWSGPLRWEA